MEGISSISGGVINLENGAVFLLLSFSICEVKIISFDMRASSSSLSFKVFACSFKYLILFVIVDKLFLTSNEVRYEA